MHCAKTSCRVLVNPLAQFVQLCLDNRFEAENVAILEKWVHSFAAKSMKVVRYRTESSLASSKLRRVEAMLISDTSA